MLSNETLVLTWLRFKGRNANQIYLPDLLFLYSFLTTRCPRGHGGNRGISGDALSLLLHAFVISVVKFFFSPTVFLGVIIKCIFF